MHEINRSSRLKQPNKKHDRMLLLIQKAITEKVSRTSDESMIKFYLQQTNEIAKQRLALRKKLEVM